MRHRIRRFFPAIALVGAVVFFGATDAMATEAEPVAVAVGEVAAPPPSTGVDAATIRDAAEGAIKQIDAAVLRGHRRVVVSFAMLAAVEGKIACTINATMRDARTGALIAIIESNAHADGKDTVEVRKQVAEGAVRSAVRRIATALSSK